ncbi:MAG: L,D-transpeptidase [Gemmatimonadaceae bacterium]
MTNDASTTGNSREGRWVVVALGVAVVGLAASMAVVGAMAGRARYQRDVTREVLAEDRRRLDELKRTASATADSLAQVVSTSVDSVGTRPFIVVSIADHRLWYRQGNNVIFSTRVATGSGKVLAREGSSQWKFETPRGRLVVQSKESDPTWVPPDWHYVEVATKKHAKVQPLSKTKPLALSDGSQIAVEGAEIVRRSADGTIEALEGGEGRELVVEGKVIMPPIGTNQRRFAGVVGTHRLNLGDGYALHGTDVPSSIGQSVSHGCVRLRNEDIETLFRLVTVGTPVYIY